MPPRLRNALRLLLVIPGSLAGIVLILPLLAVLAPFMLINGLIRLIARTLAPTTVDWKELVEFDPDLGWTTRANLNTHAVDLAGDAFHLVTDENGWPGRTTLQESDVVVFGDSFALGFGVDSCTFFANQRGAPLLKAIGAPAYSVVQPVLMLERLAEQLSGKLVVLLIYHGNDLEDTLRPTAGKYRCPFVRYIPAEQAWTVHGDHVSLKPWNIPYDNLSYEGLIDICSDTYLGRRVFQALEYLLGRAQETCHRAGADLLVMTIPELSPVVRERIDQVLEREHRNQAYDPDLPDREIRRICSDLSIGFVPLKAHLGSRDYLERDVHWNSRGHRKVAAVLRSIARDRAAGGWNDYIPARASAATSIQRRRATARSVRVAEASTGGEQAL